MVGGMPVQVLPRVHAVVLTRERTEQLGRCVKTALMMLDSRDVLTVLDDSNSDGVRHNNALLRGVASGSNAVMSHLEASRTHATAAQTEGTGRVPWQVRNAARDIAPLRNLSLLIAVVVGARTTVLIDDDIAEFDLLATHRFLESQPRGAGGVVVGAEIGGWTEMDTVTRVEKAMEMVGQGLPGEEWDVKKLFRVSPNHCVDSAQERRWVSAGYMAFDIPTPRLLAFPPGYNEDWLWCLLQQADQGTRILRSGQTVSHEPPSLRRPTHEDVRFELAGDFVLDAFLECTGTWARNGKSALAHLGGHRPDASLQPALRVTETIQRAEVVERSGRLPGDLWEHGLRVLEEIGRDTDVGVEGKTMVSAWCREAELKRKAFERSLRNSAVLSALRGLMNTRRI